MYKKIINWWYDQLQVSKSTKIGFMQFNLLNNYSTQIARDISTSFNRKPHVLHTLQEQGCGKGQVVDYSA